MSSFFPVLRADAATNTPSPSLCVVDFNLSKNTHMCKLCVNNAFRWFGEHILTWLGMEDVYDDDDCDDGISSSRIKIHENNAHNSHR